MEILKFIETECKTFINLDDRSKAIALLNATNQRILKNKNKLYIRKTDVTEMFEPLNIPENYLIELLKFYLNVGSFDVTIIERDNKIFEEIKKKLQSIFK